MRDAETVAQVRAAEAALRKRLADHGKLTGCNSYVSRTLGCGIFKAMCLVDFLEQDGIVTSSDDNGERKFLK